MPAIDAEQMLRNKVVSRFFQYLARHGNQYRFIGFEMSRGLIEAYALRGFLFNQQKFSIALNNGGNSDIGFPNHICILQIKKGRVTPAFFKHVTNYLVSAFSAAAFLAFLCFLALLAFFSFFSSALVSALAGAAVVAAGAAALAGAASAATAVKETAANTAAISTDNSLLMVNRSEEHTSEL